MKKIERMCERILKTIHIGKNQEYKEKMLEAIENSKKTGYKMTPYELFWLKSFVD